MNFTQALPGSLYSDDRLIWQYRNKQSVQEKDIEIRYLLYNLTLSSDGLIIPIA